jgi:hypothetical protein
MDHVHKPSDCEHYTPSAEPLNTIFKVLYKFDILGHQSQLKRCIDLVCYVTVNESQKI